MNRGRRGALNRGNYVNRPGPGPGRGGGSRRGGPSPYRGHDPAGGGDSTSKVTIGNKLEVSHHGRETSGNLSKGSISETLDHRRQDLKQSSTKEMSPDLEKLELVEDLRHLPKEVGFSSRQLDCLSPPASASASAKGFSLSSAQSDVRNKGFSTWRAPGFSSRQLDCLCPPASASASAKGFSSSSAQSDVRNKGFSTWRAPNRKLLSAERGSCNSLASDSPPVLNNVCVLDKPPPAGSLSEKTLHEKTAGSGHSENSKSLAGVVPFEICPVRSRTGVTLKAPLHVQNKIKRNEAKRTQGGAEIIVLRSGMLLLRRYISFNDQVKIVKACRNLGLGSGGFYEPAYRDGGKLHLKMMCLGKNWDPETCQYGDQRPIDEAKPPVIPTEFCQLVTGAIQASHSYLREHTAVRGVEEVLPSVSPNICIVNFYTKTGRLGLHQDKDESQSSLNRQLPVVSFSIGDSAEFLYGDQRDTDKADKVTLESGDVLIFGGKSRLIYHGVAAIFPDTAPKALLDETNLIPGRLNLTFREY
ncbi:uncharacterized protein LOC127790637 isoform X1 [Diospyros lotus]|uniref:uncharacterized protein LOC127790637 isoform X1 n=1 Tax=Diospyros lotus TaxID=55363 RepID=UPI00224FD88C|nr:uncharacterized protein LOC127790637 isoform X1 [Diospyros lotus]